MIIENIQAPRTQMPKSDADKASLNYDSFLKLMLQQLKSQDPTDPVDQKESLAQLAAFSSVEQSIKINQKLEALMQQTSLANASSLIGKQIESLVTGQMGKVASVEVSASGAAAVLMDGTKIDIAAGVRLSAE